MRFLTCALLLTVSACGEEANALWGSVDESYALGFDRVDILKQDLRHGASMQIRSRVDALAAQLDLSCKRAVAPSTCQAARSRVRHAPAALSRRRPRCRAWWALLR